MTSARWSPIGVALLTIILLSTNPSHVQSANPSFNCRKARAPDEFAICRDSRLAELDQAASIAYDQVMHRKDTGVSKEEWQKTARDALEGRRACGADRLCILDQQVNEIESFSEFSTVSVPPWVGDYRLKLFAARREPPSVGLPTRVGQCTITKLATISSRFGEELKPPADEYDSSGSAVSYANRGYQVSYSYVPAIADSRIGDRVLLCLVSIPKDCPPGDDRGRFYSATNLRTKDSWLLPDAQHMCGGA
jgi:uncharacterized protein